jgi:phosphate transport system substrate-binding protein
MTAGSIVLAHSLKDVPNLKLSREAYVDIFSGKITKWNDPAIASVNPDAKLPDAPIHVIVRADSSGTTFVFTKHLSAVSKAFEQRIGVNTMPNWPVGTRSKGNEGITASLQTTPGSIGYIEYGYAYSQKLPVATLQNKAGNYVAPTTASAGAALASADMPPDLVAWISDPEGKDAYPIVTYTWMLFYKKYDSQAKAKALRSLIDYSLTDGQKESEALGYVPLPPNIVTKVKAAAETIS